MRLPWGRFLIIGRLAVRDIRHRPAQAILLLLAITAATAVLSLGLVMRGVTNQPYQQTRAATRGPDLVADLGFFGGSSAGGPCPGAGCPGPSHAARLASQVSALVHMRGVTGSTGPYLIGEAVITGGGHRAGVVAEGRDEAPASIDQPFVVSGTWVRPGGVVLERTFAEALGVSVGAWVTLAGQPYTVTGIAVTAAEPPYPNLCYLTGGISACGAVNVTSRDFGMAWVTKAAAQAVAKASGLPPLYLLNLRLSDHGDAEALANAYDHANQGSFLTAWPDIASADGLLIADQQTVLDVGAWLASLLAIASVAVLAGGRMTEQSRRTGLLKAAGATPETVAAVRLATRRLRRAALSMASVAVTVSGLVAVLTFHTLAGVVQASGAGSGLANPVIDRDEQMLTVLTIMLIALSALNAVTATWATVLDTRRSSALSRALGATPRQVSLGQMAAQVIPAVPGAIAGMPLGLLLFSAADSGHAVSWPPAWWLAAVAAIAYLPAWLGTRPSAASVLQAEIA